LLGECEEQIIEPLAVHDLVQASTICESAVELRHLSDAQLAVAAPLALVGELLCNKTGNKFVIDRGGVLASEVGKVDQVLGEVLRAPSEQLLGGQLVEAETLDLEGAVLGEEGSW
jgi:hypothetical protein